MVLQDVLFSARLLQGTYSISPIAHQAMAYHLSPLLACVIPHCSFAKLPKRPARLEICYSPSRPLDLAWQECLAKGFMIVKKVFPIEVMK
jgi:hypothetical protein